MIPAPVTRSATTVPGSGIGVGLTEGGEGYMFPSPGGAIIASSGGGSCTGSGIGAGDSTIGSTGTGFVMTRGGWVGDCGLLPQAGEKFPGPHTNCAEAGGAAAR